MLPLRAFLSKQTIEIRIDDKAHTHPVLAFVNGCYIRLLFLRFQTFPIPSKDAVRMMDSSFGCVAIEQTGL